MLLPGKKTISELGLEKFKIKGCDFSIIAMDQYDYAKNGCTGVEFETRWSPTGEELRRMKAQFMAHGLLKLEDATNELAFLEVIRKYILNDISELIITEKPDRDGGGVELRFHPATHNVWVAMRSELRRITEVTKKYGFTDTLGLDGIHLNMDKNLFGDTVVEQRNAFANFIWYLFKQQIWMTEFCNRKRTDEGFADMLTILGDRFGNLTTDELKKVFLAEKSKLLDALDSPDLANALNIQVNKNGRPTVEWRWCASTQDERVFMSYIDFAFAMPEYCRSHKSPMTVSLTSFCEFISLRKETYGALYHRMSTMLNSAKIMKTKLPLVNKDIRYKKTYRKYII